jgi:hypothetical protein
LPQAHADRQHQRSADQDRQARSQCGQEVHGVQSVVREHNLTAQAQHHWPIRDRPPATRCKLGFFLTTVHPSVRLITHKKSDNQD